MAKSSDDSGRGKLHDTDQMIIKALGRNLSYAFLFAALTAIVVTLIVAFFD